MVSLVAYILMFLAMPPKRPLPSGPSSKTDRLEKQLKKSRHERKAAVTHNLQNQPALDNMLEGYDLCTKLELFDRRHGFSNAINALRLCLIYVNTLDKAGNIKWLSDKFIGNFVVESACGGVPEPNTCGVVVLCVLWFDWCG